MSKKLLIVPALLALSLAACSPNDNRSAGQIAEDAAITAKVKTKMGADEAVPALAIDVDTYKNDVTLTGTVENTTVAKRAINIARGVDGVDEVHSQLIAQNR